MDEIIKMLDKNLDYSSHEFINDVYYIKVIGVKLRIINPLKFMITKALKDYYKLKI